MIRVSEDFYSIQGEGATMGVPAVFLRLQACNLMCGGLGTERDGKLHNGAKWRCDTIEVWKQGVKHSIEGFGDYIIKTYGDVLDKGAHLIWTGGEPLMQQKAIIDVMVYLAKEGLTPYVEIETNGTLRPKNALDVFVDLYNVSPKLSNSGVTAIKRYRKEVLSWYQSKNAIFKFVVSNEEDWSEIVQMDLPYNMLYLMPSASNREELEKSSKIVTKICLEKTIKFSTRLQIVLWNQTVGV
tara:strand:+ start:5143 stop:5862 length:720 start_codon:yes stop_codon:yes gene_type:complete